MYTDSKNENISPQFFKATPMFRDIKIVLGIYCVGSDRAKKRD
jgi:hypothetical protein